MPNHAARLFPIPSGTRASPLFTTRERDLIRRELHPRFGQDPAIADGIMLRVWRGGPHQGQPKLPPAVQSMIERDLVELRTDGRWPTAQFTAAGLIALRHLAQDRRALDPTRYAHTRRELGLDAVEGDCSAGEKAGRDGAPPAT